MVHWVEDIRGYIYKEKKSQTGKSYRAGRDGQFHNVKKGKWVPGGDGYYYKVKKNKDFSSKCICGRDGVPNYVKAQKWTFDIYGNLKKAKVAYEKPIKLSVKKQKVTFGQPIKQPVKMQNVFMVKSDNKKDNTTTDKVTLSKNERMLLYNRLRNILDSKRSKILYGIFIPTRENLVSIDIEIIKLKGDNHVNKIINRWIQKNTDFKNLSELKKFFLGKTQGNELYEFLNSIKERVLTGNFIPTLENVLRAIPKLKQLSNKKIISNLINYWIKKNTPYQNLKEIRETFDPDQILFKELRALLDSLKDEILLGRFIPTQENIIAEDGKFGRIKNKNEFSHRISRWIKKNTDFKSLSELKANVSEISRLKEELRALLDSLKDEISNGRFIPTEENIISLKNKFEKLNRNRIIYNIVRWWLQVNTEFSNITEIVEKFIDKKPSTKHVEILDSRKTEILLGKFIPNKFNLRKFYPEFDDYESSRKIIAKWLKLNFES